MTRTKSPIIDVIHHRRFEDGVLEMADSSVDMILTDPPYGITDCAWDVRPDLGFMWREFNRVLKEDGAAVLTATQPFATDVINANRKAFRYDLVWVKSNPCGFLNARRMPLRKHELVLVFYRRLPTYHPQMGEAVTRPRRSPPRSPSRLKAHVYRDVKPCAKAPTEGRRFPTSILPFAKEGAGPLRHPTQKPVALFEYLIRTFSDPGDLVFDPYMGSGTTAVAAIRTGRRYLGFERDRQYIALARDRILAS